MFLPSVPKHYSMAKNGIHRTIIYINGKEVAVRVSANSGLSYFFLLLGDRARYPLKLRPEGLVTGTSFAKGNALKLEFPDETFDAVTSNYVYHNIPSCDRQAILLETLRVLKKGGTFAIHDIFSRFKYGDMHAFVKKLKGMGYEEVELIDTTNGMFMSPWEAKWMGLSGSAILKGKK